jgi:hypothetical protein
MMHFTPQVRKAIYAAAAGLIPLLVAAGTLSTEQGQLILNSVAAALAFFSSILAMTNVATNLPESDEFEDVTEGTEPPQIPGTNL